MSIPVSTVAGNTGRKIQQIAPGATLVHSAGGHNDYLCSIPLTL